MQVAGLLMLISAGFLAGATIFGIIAVFETRFALDAAVLACLGGLFGFVGRLVKAVGNELNIRFFVSIRKK